ncbi:MAG: hypothetical protein SCK29_10440 [Bacillota bacterium]|nr:hypothetical protein [Bacillota bacterium]MDW7684519.1 hypothetical protein [Bacillota bacterium]
MNTTIVLPRPVTDENFSIHINNRDDRPLQIGDVTVHYLVDKIVFDDIGTSPYTLYFQNPEAEKPHYEIAQFAHLIENERQDTARLGIVTRYGGEEVKSLPAWTFFSI